MRKKKKSSRIFRIFTVYRIEPHFHHQQLIPRIEACMSVICQHIIFIFTATRSHQYHIAHREALLMYLCITVHHIRIFWCCAVLHIHCVQWGLWRLLQSSEDALPGSCVRAMLWPRQLRTPHPWAHWSADEANLQERTGHTRPYSSYLGGRWFRICSAISSTSAHSDGKVCCSLILKRFEPFVFLLGVTAHYFAMHSVTVIGVFSCLYVSLSFALAIVKPLYWLLDIFPFTWGVCNIFLL